MVDHGTVQALFEDGAVGPLLDYFDDEGIVERHRVYIELERAVAQATVRQRSDVREARERLDRLIVHGREAEIFDARIELRNARTWCDGRVRFFMERLESIMAEFHVRHPEAETWPPKKSFDRGTVRAMLDAGDVGPLLDYFDDHGYDLGQIYDALYDAVKELLGSLQRVRDGAAEGENDAWDAARRVTSEARRAAYRMAYSEYERAVAHLFRENERLRGLVAETLQAWNHRHDERLD